MALANVRQYVSPEGATWNSALEAAREMFEQVGDLEEFRDERAELGEVIIRIGEGLADRARNSADPKALTEAESAVPLHAQVAGQTAPAFLNRSRLPSKLAEARAAVKKAQVRSAALAAMDKALADGAAAPVYDARDALLDQYADLARDKDLVTRMTAANELIRKAVAVDTSRRAAGREPRPDPLGPPFSLVLRASPAAAASSAPESPIVFALADGLGYALDGTTGAPLWHVPLGLASQYPPQPIPGDPSVLAFDSRFNELVRLDAKTGALRWRLELGEPVSDPPLVQGNQLAQVLPSGKLLLIALESGELQSTVNLGRPLARAPVNDESGQHLYVLGRQDCLFVLARDPVSCVAVHYLGPDDRGRRLELANASVRRRDRVGDRRQGRLRGVRGRGLCQQDAVSFDRASDARRDVVGPGLRAGAVGSRAVGGLRPLGAVCARPRAGIDRAQRTHRPARAGAGADPGCREPRCADLSGPGDRRRCAPGHRRRDGFDRLEDCDRRVMADGAGRRGGRE
jgi:hypothetical protein